MITEISTVHPVTRYYVSGFNQWRGSMLIHSFIYTTISLFNRLAWQTGVFQFLGFSCHSTYLVAAMPGLSNVYIIIAVVLYMKGCPHAQVSVSSRYANIAADTPNNIIFGNFRSNSRTNQKEKLFWNVPRLHRRSFETKGLIPSKKNNILRTSFSIRCVSDRQNAPSTPVLKIPGENPDMYPHTPFSTKLPAVLETL